MSSWTVTEAKAKFSEVIEKAKEAPQEVTRHGKPAVFIVSAEEWEKRTQRKGSLAEFLLNSPLAGSGIDIRRVRSGPRKVEF
jgi:prevent-host-death family protein